LRDYGSALAWANLLLRRGGAQERTINLGKGDLHTYLERRVIFTLLTLGFRVRSPLYSPCIFGPCIRGTRRPAFGTLDRRG
jgi:hypothetical protein